MNPAAGSPAGGLHVDLGSGDRRGLRTQTHQSVVVTKQGKTHSYTVDGGVSIDKYTPTNCTYSFINVEFLLKCFGKRASLCLFTIFDT